MFNFFKSKTTIAEIIAPGFIDIHSHILPGIDDGAKNTSDSVQLLSEFQQLGFSKVIGTPHTYKGVHDNTNASIKSSFDILNEQDLPNVDIGYASEYMLDFSLFERIENKSLLTLKDNFVLVEMSYVSKPTHLFDLIFKLKVNGYIPVMAHPERYRFLFDDFNQYKILQDRGCLFQLNLLSITGYYGYDVLKIADKLLKNNLISFVGSDVHHQRHIACIKGNLKTKKFDSSVLISALKELENAIVNNGFFSDNS